jgi:uncharacterized DUF497 family protein
MLTSAGMATPITLRLRLHSVGAHAASVNYHAELANNLHCKYTVGMHHFTFEWDSTKSDSNLRKHGVSFEEAKTVFTDEFGRLISDPDHSELGEDRFLLLGTSIDSRLLVVCHCIRQEDRIRIISARKAEKRERKVYERYRHA